MLQPLARVYQHAFDSRPYLTLATANGVLSSFADCVAQASQILLSNDHAQKYDLPRTARFLAFGIGMGILSASHPTLVLIALGPVIGRWNTVLEVAFPLRHTGRSQVNPIALAKRVLSDQLLM